MRIGSSSASLRWKTGELFAFFACVVFFFANLARADSGWWLGLFKADSPEAKAITREIELSPDYIFFIFGDDVSLQWRQVSCGSKSCIFEIIDPKPVKLKDDKALCSGTTTVRYISVSQAGGGKFSLSFMPSKGKGSSCLTAKYKR